MKTYFCYFDVTTKLFFYYDVATGATTWQFPTDGKVYEPHTLRRVLPPGSRAPQGDANE